MPKEEFKQQIVNLFNIYQGNKLTYGDDDDQVKKMLKDFSY